MATTLDDIRAGVRLRLGLNSSDPALTDADLLIFVNAAITQLDNLRNWWWNEADDTITTADGTSLYAFFADSRKTQHLSIGDDTIKFRTKLDLIKYKSDSGRPRFWTVESGQYRLYPTPDDVYTVDVVYQAEPTALASGSDTVVWPDWAADAIVLTAAQLAAAKTVPDRVQDIAIELGRVMQGLLDDSLPTVTSAMPARRDDWTA